MVHRQFTRRWHWSTELHWFQNNFWLPEKLFFLAYQYLDIKLLSALYTKLHRAQNEHSQVVATHYQAKLTRPAGG